MWPAFPAPPPPPYTHQEQQSAARGTSPVNVSHYTAESLPLTSVHAAPPASTTWSIKLKSPLVVAGVLSVLAVVAALTLGGAGGGAAPSVNAPAPSVATDTVVAGGGAGQAFEVVDELDAQIRQLEEETQASSGHAPGR